jgi:CheY-like chemotaxis protein
MAGHRPILVVEDDARVREAMGLVLGVEGYRVAVVANGQEALEYLRSNETPGLILLDLLTPIMDGREFRQQQLRDPALAAIPVLIISGTADVKEEAASLGVAGYIQKPIDLPTLLCRVRLVLTPARSEVLVVEEHGEVSELLRSALRHLGLVVHVATSSRQALDLCERRGSAITLVVLNAAMEDENGPTVTALRRLHPGVRCCWINHPSDPGSAKAVRVLRELVR